MLAVPVGCHIVDAWARTHASTCSSELRSTSAKAAACPVTKPSHVGAETKRAAERTAARITWTSNVVLRNAGSIIGESKGDDDARVTDPLDDGDTSTVKMIMKYPVVGMGVPATVDEKPGFKQVRCQAGFGRAHCINDAPQTGIHSEGK